MLAIFFPYLILPIRNSLPTPSNATSMMGPELLGTLRKCPAPSIRRPSASPRADKRRLRKHAERWKLSLAGLIQMVLMQWLEDQEKKALAVPNYNELPISTEIQS